MYIHQDDIKKKFGLQKKTFSVIKAFISSGPFFKVSVEEPYFYGIKLKLKSV